MCKSNVYVYYCSWTVASKDLKGVQGATQQKAKCRPLTFICQSDWSDVTRIKTINKSRIILGAWIAQSSVQKKHHIQQLAFCLAYVTHRHMLHTGHHNDWCPWDPNILEVLQIQLPQRDRLSQWKNAKKKQFSNMSLTILVQDDYLALNCQALNSDVGRPCKERLIPFVGFGMGRTIQGNNIYIYIYMLAPPPQNLRFHIVMREIGQI